MQHEHVVLEEEFRLAIHQTHNCEAEYLEDIVDVKVALETGVQWEGKVHVFHVSGHAKGARCYAWPEPVSHTAMIIRVVLHSGRVASAEQAVRSVLRRQAERRRTTNSSLRPRSG
jgi:hypothetical protein